MLIDIKDIVVLARQRKELDPAKVQELAISIEARGLLHPIVVRKPLDEELGETQGKPYVLSVGGRRLAAHIMLGRAQVESRLKEDITDLHEARMVELEENIRRVDLTWQEAQAARTEMTELLRKADPTLTNTEIAEELGISKSQMSKDTALAEAVKADPSLLQAASKGSAIRAATFRTEMARRAKVAAANVEASDIEQKIVTADALEFLGRFPAASFDLVFSDLPYGIDYFEQVSTGSDVSKGSYDDDAAKCKAFIASIIPECLRVVKPTGWIVFFMCYEWHGWLQEQIASRGLTSEMPPWIWTRRGRGNHGHWPELHASNRYEMLVVVNAGSATLTKKPVENVLDYPPFEGERLHAMQKPHDLCREIIERTTLVGERILDVCYGSGAHLAAAASLGRDFAGCDINPLNRSSALQLVGRFYKPGETANAVAARASQLGVGAGV